MRFHIQFENGFPAYDFCWHVIEAIKYNNWYTGNKTNSKSLLRLDQVEQKPYNIPFKITEIPIGSVEFVHKYMELFKLTPPLPINIPEELNSFTGRSIYPNLTNEQVEDFIFHSPEKICYMKSMTKVKGYNGVVHEMTNFGSIPEDTYLLSEQIDIESEWRGFFHNNELIDIKHYSGNPFAFPDISIIRNMINIWESKPIAGTIDVAITTDHELVIMECHNFYSCGLYGFTNYSKLLTMHSQWWNQFLKEQTKL